MDLKDKLLEIAARIPRQLDHIATEEATKNSLVLPFIQALGYNVFDASEVTPELNADIGLKKGEKVDYAILRDGKPIMLIECKHHATNLDQAHLSQLYRYFSVTEARFGILTNGLVYWFYTDMEAPNKMDSRPFFEFSILDVRDATVAELKKFSKSAFDLNNILTTASELKYTREITRYLVEQMAAPNEDFVKVITSHVYSGRLTQPVREQFTAFVRQAFALLINERINERLKSALATETVTVAAPVAGTSTETSPQSQPEEPSGKVVTTDEELEAFFIVRAILREMVSPQRVVMRDVQSYCGILLDDNNRKPICRLYFNATQKYVTFYSKGEPEKVAIDDIDGLYKYANWIKATVERYDKEMPPKKRGRQRSRLGSNQ